ncbi:MAG TPA: NAD(P)H-hydrate epimerase, partial [Candidatus Sulfotelmatobacter sp.]|nr:NAD(P)H-hydrate epimerase [Candidatus Sulfotelmatobacter sp.]
MIELLSVAEMYRADAAAVRAGVAGETLMENAGAAVAREIIRRFAPRPVAILCGPGNNGGDGFVVTRHLRQAGWPVRLALLGERAGLRGDAALMAGRFDGRVEPLSPATIAGAELIVDALFGAGLARPLAGVAAEVVAAANAAAIPVVAVDVPSGLHGDSGQVLGSAFQAALTVTFFRRKPGHLLLPGRVLCGETVVVDIGIPAAALGEIAPRQWQNDPALWGALYPWPRIEGHKYSRGHALVVSGEMAETGAARLSARAALRVGAGLVTLASPANALAVNAAALTAVMVRGFADADDFARLLAADARRNAVLLGPGNGVGATTRANVLAALASGRRVVLDADALTVFADDPGVLFAAIRSPCVLTPHAGEFARLFDAGGDKLARTRAAAARARAVVL